MPHPLARELETLAAWRQALRQQLDAFAGWLADADLLGEVEAARAAAVCSQLAADGLVLACVGEVARGKSELLNAIFFGDARRRMLPAGPGRTTMCPVELRCDAARPQEIALLPVETRLDERPLAAWRTQPDAWERLSLDRAHAAGMVEALQLVTRTRRVDAATAEQLGFWRDERPPEQPPADADATVEVPAWRHAVINVAHPWLRQGLVVVDTPGLNAVGAEPELTLGLLASAHALVFVLSADTGVSRSDWELWTNQLRGQAAEHFVVLNKADVLTDPLADAAHAARQLQTQRARIAQLLQVPLERVFALSARTALAARIDGDADALARSGLPGFEAALAAQLLPRRRELVARAAAAVVDALQAEAARRILQRRRQTVEQLAELRDLRGRSAAKLRMLRQRLDAEVADFDGGQVRVAAVRAVLRRQLQQLHAHLDNDGLRAEAARMRTTIAASTLARAAAQAFEELFARLRERLAAAVAAADESAQMLGACFGQLNAQYGFAFTPPTAPQLRLHGDELALIERSYRRYVGPAQAWRLAGAAFAEQFQRMLVARLRVVFETAAAEVDLWGKAAVAQLERQLQGRRLAFAQRRDALERVRSAAGGLEQRIAEVEEQGRRLGALQQHLDASAGQLRARVDGAAAAPGPAAVDARAEAAAPLHDVAG